MRTCPYCSTENEAFFRFCLGCGADLDEAAPAEPEPAPVAATPAPAIKLRPSVDTVTDVQPVNVEPVTRPKTAERVARPTEDEPRPVDRAKTFDGGQAKIANSALHAVGQAQLDLAKRQPVAVSAREEKAEGPTKRGGSGPEVAPPVPRGEKSAPMPRPDKRVTEPTTQPRSVETRKTRPDAKKAPSRARLVVILEDGTDGSVLDLLPQATLIGREGADISFPHDDFLARHHAEFYFEGDSLLLRPLESTNGVFVQVHQEVELDSGDVFRSGQQLLHFEMLAEVASEVIEDPRGQAIPLGSPIPEGAWGRLGQLIAPDTLGSVYLLGGTEVYLGRERGDITFPGDGFVSGLHAQISQRAGRCFLKDLGSSNGTYLRLSQPAPVMKGTLVLAGQQLFRVDL